MSPMDKLQALGGGSQNQLSKAMKRDNSQRIVELDCDQVLPRKQTREAFNNIEELANSIDQHGQYQPIRVMKAQGYVDAEYEVLMGERRWRACQHLGVPVQAIIVERIEDPAEMLAAELTENLQREDLSPFEIAKGLADLADQGLTNRDIAQKLSMGESYVSRLLKLQHAPVAVRALYDQGYSKDSEVFHLLTQLWKKDQRTAERLISMAAETGISRKDAREALKSFQEKTETENSDGSTSSALGSHSPATEEEVKDQLQNVSVGAKSKGVAGSMTGERDNQDEPLPTGDRTRRTEGRKETQHSDPAIAPKPTEMPVQKEPYPDQLESNAASVKVRLVFSTDDNPDNINMGTLSLEPGASEGEVFVVDGDGVKRSVSCENVSLTGCFPKE